MNKEDIIAAARSALGTPFRHQGRVAGLGLDCAGLYVHVCKALGINHADARGYPRTPYDGKLEQELDAQPCLRRIAIEEAAAGDLLAMRITSAPQHIAFHVGFIDGHAYIVHASEKHGGVVEHRLDQLIDGRVVRAYRLEAGQ